MEISAVHRFARLSPQKARLVADQIRGMPVERAVELLTFSNKNAAAVIKKVLESAIANAEHNEGADIDGVPLPRALRQARSYRWQRMATDFSRRTVAYELLPGAQALLFASKTQRALQLPAKPPANPRVRSGLWIYLVAWQETNCLYVVALKRNAQRQYERLLRVGTPASFT